MAKIKVVYNSSSATALKFRGSVIQHVAPKVIFFLCWSIFIFCLNRYAFATPGALRIETSLITLLGLVISLLLVFRTNTAYDRYWEGRRLWSDLSMSVRSMSRLIWVHCEEKDGQYCNVTKKKAIQLLIAFPYACKLHLRGEHGIEQPEVKEFIDHIPDIVQSPHAILAEKNESSEYQVAPLSAEGQCFHLPILLTHQISCFVAGALNNGSIQNPVASTLIANINTLVASLTGFERILTTPIPTAYSVHLSQAIWLFCLSLPFQVLNMFKSNDWVMIIVVCLTAFTMFGIINIGEEIENPFGLDANDLPLNEYCTLLRHEIEAITRRPPPQVKDWVFKKESSTHLQVPPAAAHITMVIPS